MWETSIIEFAEKQPLKAPIWYSMKQVEISQNLGNHNFAAHFEADNFIQKVINLLKYPDSTKIDSLPAPWREKFRCLSLDSHSYFYIDERLVISKAFRPIILRSLHCGHPGRDSLLATVANVWCPSLHREVVGAQICQPCKTAGKIIRPLLRQN